MRRKPKTSTALPVFDCCQRNIASGLIRCLVAVLVGHFVGPTLQAQSNGSQPFEKLAQETSGEVEPSGIEPIQREPRAGLQNDLRQIDLSTTPMLSTPNLKPVPSRAAVDSIQNNSTSSVQTWKLIQWTAPNDVYQNLLFEDAMLERHGINTGLTKLGLLRDERMQPVVSGLNFFTRGAIYPLSVLKRNQKRCDNPLGWGLPSSY